MFLMEPYKEIIIKFIIENGEKLSSGTKLEISAKDIVESECYQLILKIKAIIEYAFMSDTQKHWQLKKSYRVLMKLVLPLNIVE